MTRYPEGYKHAVFQIIADAAHDPSIGSSVALDTLVGYVGWNNLFAEFDALLFALLDESGDLEGLADAMIETLYDIPGIEGISPFDGTITVDLDEAESEVDWLLTEDILPFLQRWSNVLLGYDAR